MIGGNNGIVEIYSPYLNMVTKTLGPLYKQNCIAPKWALNLSSTQSFEEGVSTRCFIIMGKANLARRGMLFDCLPLTPMRSFNIADTYSMVEISKWRFLVGHKLSLIWSVLVK